MASILNKISFQNFFNYYGEYDDNEYELEPGLNIIVADNGAGKSKFFNAFLWLFNDQILDSDDKNLKSIRTVYTKIVSDKAKYEAQIGDTITSGVKVEFTFGKRKKYSITKSFTITKLSDDISDLNSWTYIPGDVEVNETELVLVKYKPVYDEDEKRKIIEKLIQPAFRKYSFLQGEEIDKMIDFSQKESIEEAVQNLTDISKYDLMVELTSEFSDKSLKDYERKAKELDKFGEQLKDALTIKQNNEEKLKQEQLKLSQFKETYEKAKNKKIELDKHYSNAEKRKEIDDKLKIVNTKLREKSNELSELLDRVNNRLFEGNFAWISMGLEKVVVDFSRLRENYTEKHFEKRTLVNMEKTPNDYLHFLPADSPDTVSVKKMIENEHCYVCNRPAKKNTPEHDYLIRLKNRKNDQQKEKSYVKNNLKDVFDGIQTSAQPFYSRIPLVRDSIIRVKEIEEELNEQIDKLKAKVKSLKAQRSNILVGGLDNGQTDRDIISSYSGAITRMEHARTTIDDIISPKIKRLKAEIINVENEISNLSHSGDVPTEFGEHYNICKDIAVATQKARDKVLGDMIDLLENYANAHFTNLISNNDLAGGILKFEKTNSDAINFNYVDSKGNLVTGNSEGFQRMKKFAVVLAIITANKIEYNYPLLADAPISAFGAGFTQGFFKATGVVFPQSIILVKELYDKEDEMKLNDLGKQLLKDEKVSSFYVNHVPEGAEQIDLITSKTKLK